jgi:hypothetical protein
MSVALLTCPKCSVHLRPPAEATRVRCGKCGTVVAVAAPRPASDEVTTRRPTASRAIPAPARPSVPVTEPATPQNSRMVAAIAAACLIGFLAVGLLAALLLMKYGGRKDPATELAKGPDTVTPVQPAPTRERPQDSGEPALPPLPVLENTLSPEMQKAVDTSLEKAVKYVKQNFKANNLAGHHGGYPPLVGLTLLECDVPADDPVVAKIIKMVRKEGPNLQETYGLSLCILFLDRLGEEEDRPLIRKMAARLIAGQTAAGGWTYGNVPASDNDLDQMLAYLGDHPLPGRVAGDGPGVGRTVGKPGSGVMGITGPVGVGRVGDGDGDGSGEKKPVALKDLPPSVRNRAVVQFDPGKKLPVNAGDDNSNTQFAILGVWTAQKHGLPVDRSIAMIAQRFHQSQNADGSWGYNPGNAARPDSMTCAGLLGLAVGRANDDAAAEPARGDPAIEKGLAFLSQKVQKPTAKRPKVLPQQGNLVGAASIGDLYWLWSVERVGVIYNLQTLGGKDWYAWGAELLTTYQKDDGHWDDVSSLGAPEKPSIDSCLAMLFLKRVNVAKDLTQKLQLIGQVRDPGK